MPGTVAVLNQKGGRRQSKAKDRVLDEVTKEETTRLNAVVPVSLHKAVKIQAASEGRSITDLLVEALNEYLSKSTNQ